MNKPDITISSFETIRLVNLTYEFISSQFKMTDDDIKLVAMTLAEIIEKNKIFRE